MSRAVRRFKHESLRVGLVDPDSVDEVVREAVQHICRTRNSNSCTVKEFFY